MSDVLIKIKDGSIFKQEVEKTEKLNDFCVWNVKFKKSVLFSSDSGDKSVQNDNSDVEQVDSGNSFEDSDFQLVKESGSNNFINIKEPDDYYNIFYSAGDVKYLMELFFNSFSEAVKQSCDKNKGEVLINTSCWSSGSFNSNKILSYLIQIVACYMCSINHIVFYDCDETCLNIAFGIVDDLSNKIGNFNSGDNLKKIVNFIVKEEFNTKISEDEKQKLFYKVRSYKYEKNYYKLKFDDIFELYGDDYLDIIFDFVKEDLHYDLEKSYSDDEKIDAANFYALQSKNSLFRIQLLFAILGNGLAALHIGNGFYARKNRKKALIWYKRAIIHGQPHEAGKKIAELYFENKGIVRF